MTCLWSMLHAAVSCGLDKNGDDCLRQALGKLRKAPSIEKALKGCPASAIPGRQPLPVFRC